MACIPCGLYENAGSGGIELGGSAEVSDTVVGGGVAIGGTAEVDVAGDVWDGYVAVWLLDDFTDATDNDLDGTAGDGVAAFTPETISSIDCWPAKSFDGRQYVRVPVASKPVKAISCWLRIDAFHQERTIFSRPGFRLGYNVLRQPYLQVSDGEDTDTVYAVTSLVQGQWYHVSAEWSPGRYLSIFINGIRSNRISTSISELDTGSHAYLGRWGAASYPEIGLMDVRLYPEAKGGDWWTVEHDGLCPGLVETETTIEEVTYE